MSVGRGGLALLSLLLLCCANRAPCPAEEDRFDPGDFDVAPESTFDVWGCEGSGVPVVRREMTVILCTAEWCTEGYLGSYCVPGDAFESWREGLGLGIHCEPSGGPNGVQQCYVQCAECDRWCT